MHRQDRQQWHKQVWIILYVCAMCMTQLWNNSSVEVLQRFERTSGYTFSPAQIMVVNRLSSIPCVDRKLFFAKTTSIAREQYRSESMKCLIGVTFKTVWERVTKIIVVTLPVRCTHSIQLLHNSTGRPLHSSNVCSMMVTMNQIRRP